MSTRAGARRVLLGLLALLLVGSAVLRTAPASADEPPKVLLLLDVSGSMGDRISSGGTKFAAAQRALESVAAPLPAGTQVGLRVYGSKISQPQSKDPAACTDTTLVQPIGPLDKATMDRAVHSFSPTGETPIGYSMGKAVDDLGDSGKRVLILISDGKENCGGNPCTVAEKLADRGVDLQFNAIGLAVDATARKQLQCTVRSKRATVWARMGAMVNEQSRSSDMGRVEVMRVPVDQLTPDDLEEWRQLEAAAVSTNPFLVPEWILAWYECFVPQRRDRLVLLARLRPTGQLIGVAAMYRQPLGLGPVRLARRLVPVGAGTPSPYELPGYLAAAGQHRDVARAMVGATMDADVDWSALCTGPDQSWFEPEYVQTGTAQAGRTVDFWQHVASRACVILRLGGSWDKTRAGLKRNLKESLRRSRNRLEKSGLPYQIHQRTGAELDEQVVARLLDLHQDRSSTDRGTVSHGNYYSDQASQELVRKALPQLARRGRATVLELELDGQIVAAQLALHAPGSSYVHSSGFLPETWSYGPVTHLVGVLVQEAADRGESFVNFSPGPQVSKLRWSEEVWAWQEFGYGVGTRATLARYLTLRSLGGLRPDVARVAWHRRQLASSSTTPGVTARPAGQAEGSPASS